ncbi:hypothetical protein AVEN_90928-1 [Araneus ventricosus]|uniref:Uncharacterized protein n=1 Tax=Araneus ventricosus TaxID=182803 RepID=A0A4Y2L5E6_ARAVE|nr:hypothetical protein AVEN_90928-1 [Araneus ventricosus]
MVQQGQSRVSHVCASGCPMSIQPVRLPLWHQAREHGADFCLYRRLSHAHSTGSVAIMASGTGAWGGILSVPAVVPCPFNRFGCHYGIRHGGMGRNFVCTGGYPMSIQPIRLPLWHQARGHGAEFCLYRRLSHVHSAGSVAIMASDTEAWGGFLSVPAVVPCPFNRFGCHYGIRHGSMGRHYDSIGVPRILRITEFLID